MGLVELKMLLLLCNPQHANSSDENRPEKAYELVLLQLPGLLGIIMGAGQGEASPADRN